MLSFSYEMTFDDEKLRIQLAEQSENEICEIFNKSLIIAVNFFNESVHSKCRGSESHEVV